jgi:hypothetical protein
MTDEHPETPEPVSTEPNQIFPAQKTQEYKMPEYTPSPKETCKNTDSLKKCFIGVLILGLTISNIILLCLLYKPESTVEFKVTTPSTIKITIAKGKIDNVQFEQKSNP